MREKRETDPAKTSKQFSVTALMPSANPVPVVLWELDGSRHKSPEAALALTQHCSSVD